MLENDKNKLFERFLLEDLKKWIDRREIFAIKGPRQSGKTTLLKMLQKFLVEEKSVNPDNIIFDSLLLQEFQRKSKPGLSKSRKIMSKNRR